MLHHFASGGRIHLVPAAPRQHPLWGSDKGGGWTGVHFTSPGFWSIPSDVKPPKGGDDVTTHLYSVCVNTLACQSTREDTPPDCINALQHSTRAPNLSRAAVRMVNRRALSLTAPDRSGRGSIQCLKRDFIHVGQVSFDAVGAAKVHQPSPDKRRAKEGRPVPFLPFALPGIPFEK